MIVVKLKEIFLLWLDFSRESKMYPDWNLFYSFQESEWWEPTCLLVIVGLFKSFAVFLKIHLDLHNPECLSAEVLEWYAVL